MEFETVRQWIVLTAAILGIIHVTTAHRSAKKRFPPRDYGASPSTSSERWRWREPPQDMELEVVDRPGVSSLILDDSVPMVQKVCSGLAYLLLVVFVWGVIYRLTVVGWGADAYLMVFLLILPWALLQVGSRPVQIDLKPNEIAIVLIYGIFLHRTVRIARKPDLSVVGNLQSSVTMTIDQEMPLTIVAIGRRGLLHLKRKFYLSCNPSQGSWIAGGLQEWASSAQA